MYDICSACSPSPPIDPSTAELELARQYFRFILWNTVLTRIYGIDVAVERALRVSRLAWNVIILQGVRLPFYSFITTYFFSLTALLSEWRMNGVLWGAIPLFLPACALDAPIYRLPSVDSCSRHYYIADVVAPDHLRFIPSTLFIPYDIHSPQRRCQVLDDINPVPLWFFGENGVVGFPIQGADGLKLLQGQDELRLLNTQKKPISTLKIKFDVRL